MQRFIYVECFGLSNESLVVRHKCDNPPCINPEHLIEGTVKENIRDAVERGRNIRGVKCHLAKLTDAKVKRCRKLYASGVSYLDLARRYGVDVKTMWLVTRRATWKHVS